MDWDLVTVEPIWVQWTQRSSSLCWFELCDLVRRPAGSRRWSLNDAQLVLRGPKSAKKRSPHYYTNTNSLNICWMDPFMLFTPNYDPTIRIRPRNTFPNPWCPIYVSRSKLQPQFPDPRWQEWQLVCCSLNHLLSYSDLHHAYMRKCTELLPSDWLFRYAAWQQSVHWSCLDNLVLKKCMIS